ncbi:MAG: translation repressor protein [Acidobacteria bacterium]|nr:translation repressor protein [Acidobacteriota bacterium]
MIKIKLEKDFNVVAETLTRIGIANNRTRKLYQSCHILHKRGEYYIVHFKEMLKLDGRRVNISEEDIFRRDDIANLLHEWGLINIIDSVADVCSDRPRNCFRVIGFRDKQNWKLIQNYQIGSK